MTDNTRLASKKQAPGKPKPKKKPATATERKRKQREAKKAIGVTDLEVVIEVTFKVLLRDVAEVMGWPIHGVISDLIASFPDGIPPIKHVLREANVESVWFPISGGNRAYLERGLGHSPTPLSCGSAIEHLLVSCMSVGDGGCLTYTHPDTGEVFQTYCHIEDPADRPFYRSASWDKYTARREALRQAIDRRDKYQDKRDENDRAVDRMINYAANNFGLDEMTRFYAHKTQLADRGEREQDVDQ